MSTASLRVPSYRHHKPRLGWPTLKRRESRPIKCTLYRSGTRTRYATTRPRICGASMVSKWPESFWAIGPRRSPKPMPKSRLQQRCLDVGGRQPTRSIMMPLMP